MRASFLLDPGIRFLNHGSFGACPREVLEAWHAWQLRMERNPVAFLARESAGLLAAVRARLGAFLGARPEDLILVPNATTAVNTVARSLELREGDEVLAPDMEYGACEAAWEWVCARTGARYRRVGIPLPFEAEAFADTVWAAVTPRTRVLFLSHLCSATALVLPLEALLARARSAGILTVVDGAHAPGQLDLDLDRLGADFYTGNGHKWLCGPKGTAFLHARSEHHARLHAPVVSWGYRSEDGEAGHEGYAGNSLLEHRLQWQGTRDVAAFLALGDALEFLERVDWRARRAEGHALAVEAAARMAALTGLPPLAKVGDFVQMVALPLPDVDGPAFQAALRERFRIEVPVTRHAGRCFLRPSFQMYNTAADLEALLEAVGELLG